MGTLAKMKSTKAINERAQSLPLRVKVEGDSVTLPRAQMIALIERLEELEEPQELTPYECCAQIADRIEQLQDHVSTGKVSRDYSVFLSVLWGEFDVLCSVFPEEESDQAPASEDKPAS